MPSDRALGIKWDVNEDKIKFVANRPLTRRGILSIVGSIFDPPGLVPPGLVSPITLRAKVIVQHLCKKKLRRVDENQDEWQNWLGTLPHLQNISVNRCFKPQGFGDIKNSSFSDW